MPFGSRPKGCRAEREVAAIIQGWWRRLEAEAIFVRTPSSGGWATPAARAGFKASGDLMTTAARWPFCVEVKRREEWTWKNVHAGKPSPVWAWWIQSQVAAAETGQAAMLWLRKSREPWRVMVPVAFTQGRAWSERLPVEAAWSALPRVQHGALVPIVMLADTLLQLDPAHLATVASGGNNHGASGEEGGRASIR